MATVSKKKFQQKVKSDYKVFRKINGDHPYKDATSFSYVEYEARKRKGGKVRFFNFDLAKEIGLLKKSHPEEVNADLEAELLDCFAITIINEYDIINKVKIPEKDKLDRKYMATRYLQLQNPNKKGVYSGDGRSIWNGYFESNNGVWDITSCGTGATCLSPATKTHDRFFQTGDEYISYGCGYSTFHEGIVDVVFSEMFHQKEIGTERVLCVITFPDGFSIKVRAGKNLLRPSHVFAPLKQEKGERVKEIVNYLITREKKNKNLRVTRYSDAYSLFLTKFAKDFANISALFEQEYIFCWLDWDGDNIMTGGGVLDFGSIRQFGVYHHEYKFDDDGVWSTNIKQQRQKARETVKVMAQAIDFAKTGKKKPLAKYSRHKSLKEFDKFYEEQSRYYLARRLGFNEKICEMVASGKSREFKNISKLFLKLEQRKYGNKFLKTPDGKNAPILFNMRKFSKHSLEVSYDHTEVRRVLTESLTKMAIKDEKKFSSQDVKDASNLLKNLKKFLNLYKLDEQKVKSNAEFWNRDNRITGDGICMVAETILKHADKMSSKEMYKLVNLYLKNQISDFDGKMNYFDLNREQNRKVHKIAKEIEDVISVYSETI